MCKKKDYKPLNENVADLAMQFEGAKRLDLTNPDVVVPSDWWGPEDDIYDDLYEDLDNEEV